MIVDTSAIVAIVKSEPEAPHCARALAESDQNRISAANLFEAFLVVDRLPDPGAREAVRALQQLYTIEVVPVTEDIALLAREANLRFGKGFHPDNLNFGDCFAYALAKSTGESLLFVGNDFAQTDIEIA